jgi:F0F1-type ATP synthase assembly protein I
MVTFSRDSLSHEAHEFRSGTKAGSLAGLVQGAMTGITAVLIWAEPALRESIRANAQNALPGYTPDQINNMVNWELVSIFVVSPWSLIEGVILGAIMGLIFGGVRHRFMKRYSLPIRGLLFGLPIFLLQTAYSMGMVRTLLMPSTPTATVLDMIGPANFAVTLAVSLASSLLFGYLLGFLFAKFQQKNSIVSPSNLV